MRYFFILIVRLYQKILSPDKGFIPKLFGTSKNTCIFYPTCSEYSISVFKKHGSVKGGYLTIRRVLKCNPFNEPNIDLPE